MWVLKTATDDQTDSLIKCMVVCHSAHTLSLSGKPSLWAPDTNNSVYEGVKEVHFYICVDNLIIYFSFLYHFL